MSVVGGGGRASIFRRGFFCGSVASFGGSWSSGGSGGSGGSGEICVVRRAGFPYHPFLLHFYERGQGGLPGAQVVILRVPEGLPGAREEGLLVETLDGVRSFSPSKFLSTGSVCFLRVRVRARARASEAPRALA